MIEKNNDTFHFKSFSNLDSSPSADFLINSMDVMMKLSCIETIKRRALKAMYLKSGDKVLEIGCGHGEDAEILGKLVGRKGSVVAVDISHRMIEEAKKRSLQANVEYLTADVTKLPYADHTFSACHADRFLVSCSDLKSSVKAILRLIKPGGTLCFTDVDALSIVLAPYGRITQIMLEALHKSFVNPYIGRILPQIFIEQGLQNIVIIPEISIIRSFDTLCKIFQFSLLAEGAIKQGKLTPLEVKQWFEELREAEEKGTFLYCIKLFTVLGSIPL